MEEVKAGNTIRSQLERQYQQLTENRHVVLEVRRTPRCSVPFLAVRPLFHSGLKSLLTSSLAIVSSFVMQPPQAGQYFDVDDFGAAVDIRDNGGGESESLLGGSYDPKVCNGYPLFC